MERYDDVLARLATDGARAIDLLRAAARQAHAADEAVMGYALQFSNDDLCFELLQGHDRRFFDALRITGDYDLALTQSLQSKLVTFTSSAIPDMVLQGVASVKVHMTRGRDVHGVRLLFWPKTHRARLAGIPTSIQWLVRAVDDPHGSTLTLLGASDVAVVAAEIFAACRDPLLSSSGPSLACLFLESYWTLQSDVPIMTAGAWMQAVSTKFGWERLLSPLLSLLRRWSQTHLVEVFQLVASLGGVDPTPVCRRLEAAFLGELMRACWDQYVRVTAFEIVAGTWLHDRLPTSLLLEIAAFRATDACRIAALVAQHPTSFPPIAVVTPAVWAAQDAYSGLSLIAPKAAHCAPAAAFDDVAWGTIQLVDVMATTLLVAMQDAGGWSATFLDACYAHAGLALLPALVSVLSVHPSLEARNEVVLMLQRAPELLRSTLSLDTPGHLARYFALNGRRAAIRKRPLSTSDVQLELLLTVLNGLTSTGQIDALVTNVLRELDGAPWALHAHRSVIYRLLHYVVTPHARLRLVQACLECHKTASRTSLPLWDATIDDIYVACDCAACAMLRRHLLSDTSYPLKMTGPVPRCLRCLIYEHSDRLCLEREDASGYHVRKTPRKGSIDYQGCKKTLSMEQIEKGPDGDMHREMALQELEAASLQDLQPPSSDAGFGSASCIVPRSNIGWSFT
ncbi:hypothetical protein SPRG_00478 [Saprolegnia parasitica CBS 223.65]|uniref:Uncharacterized protein n=1 Tax=Saprolegnia parasitica (strain CBS 223.65) TaxID=695850 RepID=A0A067CY51_SAPPC|nr:hypothetical protein SPRG_00478 [Saprolegnia parasitica CBS 223.65]KDO35634.1 hypothetical protein SPRG_00478 [Saprolegnia parasitica CBS 223.65]|eukprot:XP_012193962.1 hypothetical protein SPRG_00478 [Saprolegnia parasitica CBS 223.65]